MAQPFDQTTLGRIAQATVTLDLTATMEQLENEYGVSRLTALAMLYSTVTRWIDEEMPDTATDIPVQAAEVLHAS